MGSRAMRKGFGAAEMVGIVLVLVLVLVLEKVGCD
jgi:hypothetical protein